MTAIAYGTRAYRRENGNLPELRLINMFVEHAVTGDDGVTLLSRQGLSPYMSVGAGPVKGVFSEDGVFGGDLFSVSGGILYRGSAAIGAVSGTDTVTFAAGQASELLVCAGADIHRYDGTSLSTVAFPDEDSIACVAFHDGLYLAAVKGSGRWYWSNVLDGSTWDALSFATAEAQPDELKYIKPFEDFIFLIGGETIERWANTGTAGAPYSRVEGALIPKGTLSTACVAETHERIFFVGNDGIVYILDNPPVRVSDNGIEERIAASETISLFGFILEGHSFVCLRLDTGSFLFDPDTGEWCEFSTYGRDNWRAMCACLHGKTTVFGDDSTGNVWTLQGWTDAGDVLERLFTAAFPLNGGVYPVDNLTIKSNTGWTGLLAGQGSNPVAEMRTSIDAGATWNNWRSARMGEQGKYRVKTQWKRCGTFDFPGGMFEIRVTDPIPFRVSAVVVNEENGGKSR